MTGAKILTSHTVFSSKDFKVNHVKIKRDGKIIEKDIIEDTPGVWILPYTENGEIYLASEYRDAFGKYIINCIGGKIDSRYDPLTTAKKELKEEAGLNASTWLHAATWESSWRLHKKMYIFFAKNLVKERQHLEADEKIQIIKFTLTEALTKIENGEIVGGLDIAVILLFDKYKREGKLKKN